jgi:hypothetical protein
MRLLLLLVVVVVVTLLLLLLLRHSTISSLVIRLRWLSSFVMRHRNSACWRVPAGNTGQAVVLYTLLFRQKPL